LAHHHSALRVVAFEPDPALHAAIEKNISLNPDVTGRVEIVGAAVADASGVGFFQTAGTANTGVGKLVDQATGSSVPVTSLIDFHAARGLAPDVIKVDVEGAELRVLQGL